MGMYDDLRCERVMPDGFDGSGKSFQTKAFGCDMACYEITPEGRLMQPLDAEGEVAGAFGEERVRWRDMHFHGWLNFYALVNTHPSIRWIGPENPGEWHGYNAKFTDGQLVTIECDKKTLAATERH